MYNGNGLNTRDTNRGHSRDSVYDSPMPGSRIISYGAKRAVSWSDNLYCSASALRSKGCGGVAFALSCRRTSQRSAVGAEALHFRAYGVQRLDDLLRRTLVGQRSRIDWLTYESGK